MGETIEIVARIQLASKGTLENMARLCGLSFASYYGQVLDNQAAEARALRIPPQVDHVALGDEPADEEEGGPLLRRKPPTEGEIRAICEQYRRGLRA